MGGGECEGEGGKGYKSGTAGEVKGGGLRYMGTRTWVGVGNKMDDYVKFLLAMREDLLTVPVGQLLGIGVHLSTVVELDFVMVCLG